MGKCGFRTEINGLRAGALSSSEDGRAGAVESAALRLGGAESRVLAHVRHRAAARLACRARLLLALAHGARCHPVAGSVCVLAEGRCTHGALRLIAGEVVAGNAGVRDFAAAVVVARAGRGLVAPRVTRGGGGYEGQSGSKHDERNTLLHQVPM